VFYKIDITTKKIDMAPVDASHSLMDVRKMFEIYYVINRELTIFVQQYKSNLIKW